jgi:hypothetical protein
LRDFTEGVLEGLAYSLRVIRREKGGKASARIGRQILRILESQAADFEIRSKATA